LANSDFVYAGAAASGSYNKSMTPEFQSARRAVSQARHASIKASTFFYADELKMQRRRLPRLRRYTSPNAGRAP
jgi:hypothetical protein